MKLPAKLRAALTVSVLALLARPGGAAPEPKGLGDPGKLLSVRIETGRAVEGRFLLNGPGASQQLLVTGTYSSGQVRDLTRQARYSCTPAGVAALDRSGVVTPIRDGKSEIAAVLPGVAPARIGVTVQGMPGEPRVSFANEVVPALTKLGCNTGTCHGKASGRNGFKLSLFGFEPAEDYEYIVKEGRGRRVFVPAPDSSLLMLKATAQIAHGGGKRLEKGSPPHALLRRWIKQGVPDDPEGAPVVRRIEVLPGERTLDSAGTQQILVVAHLSDGSACDVTRLTQFEANEPEMVSVSPAGLVAARGVPGRVAIMARFQTHVAVLRVTIPLGIPVTGLPPARNFIDELVFKQLKELGLPPSGVCDDATFLRRVTIDIAGRLPTLEETKQFLADRDSKKHEMLVDRLLASGEYADYFVNKWSAVLRNRRPSDRTTPNPPPASTPGFVTVLPKTSLTTGSCARFSRRRGSSTRPRPSSGIGR
jgi:hypothetical protein